MTQFLIPLVSFLIIGSAWGANAIPQPDPAFKGTINKRYQDSTPHWPEPMTAPKGAPNIVLILLDDVGFGAASTFGGPAQTPALDALAERGIRYNNFHTAALCSSTRASLLTGRNHHRVGFGTVTEIGSGFPGYNGIWKKSTASIAEVLRQNGYSTAAFGKWHNTPAWEMGPTGPFDRWPTGLGFEYFYGFMSGGTSQWEPSLYRNTTSVEATSTPEQGYHLTTDLTNSAINWIHTHRSLAGERPYFLYFATGATHSPHHVPQAWIDKYRGRFDLGWDKLREQIFDRQKALGVIPKNAVLTPRPAALPAWDSFSADQQKNLAAQMEVYAAFLAHTDHEVGRLLKVAQSDPNTLIIYIVGDNGGDATFFPAGYDNIAETDAKQRLRHLDELGSVQHNNSYAASWAWAMNSPFQWMKGVASHFGGTRNPMVISWPAGIKKPGKLSSQFSHVVDLVPTLHEVTGIPIPTEVNGIAQQPMDGTSLTYTFDEGGMPPAHRTQYFEQWGNRAIYQDGWMAAARHSLPWDRHPSDNFDDDHWELHDLRSDFTQAHDLSRQFPDKLKMLQAVFDEEAARNSVYPLINSYGSQTAHNPPWYPKDQTLFIYHADMPHIPWWSAPYFFSPHRITIDTRIPEEGAEGVLLSYGGRHGGFVIYAKNNKLFYENNLLGQHRDLITSNIEIPRGDVRIEYRFSSEGVNSAGNGSLYINGKLVGASPIAEIGYSFYHGLSIGKEFGSPVSNAYQRPYAFNGELIEVSVGF